MRDLTQQEIDTFFSNQCPQCGSKDGWYPGPSGGMSQNVECANPKCQARLNIMGMNPSINLGGQLIQESLLGDNFHSVSDSGAEPEQPRRWWQFWRRAA